MMGISAGSSGIAPALAPPSTRDPSFVRMKALNKVRLRWGWGFLALLLVVAPSPSSRWLLAGLTLIALGLLIRLAAAATLVKIESLTTHGIYQVTRNPLYLGNLLVGSGFGCLGGHWGWLVACLIFFGLIYRELILAEEAFLTERYPETFRRYAASVPRLWPRWQRLNAIPGTLSLASLTRNNEFRNALATLVLSALLVAKALLLSDGQYWWAGLLGGGGG